MTSTNPSSRSGPGRSRYQALDPNEKDDDASARVPLTSVPLHTNADNDDDDAEAYRDDDDDDNTGAAQPSSSASSTTLASAPVSTLPPPHLPMWQRFAIRSLTGSLVAIFVTIALVYMFSARGSGDGCECARPQPSVPQYFQTSPELWAGPTPTGAPAFLAQTAAFDPLGGAGYVPNEPLQTAIPVEGMGRDDLSLFKMMGYLSPYAPAPGFGVNEYPLPPGAEIVQVQMLSRHGARYPTIGTNVESFGRRMAEVADKFKAKGPLAFMNDWKYQLGAEILVPKGRQELYDSGVLHSYMYGKLYNPNSKLIVRTTTQDRMLKSAENWMAGFFGLEWTNNATIEVIIEAPNFNNSLAGYLACPNAVTYSQGWLASSAWADKYLQNATARFQEMVEGYEWTSEDTYAAQTMCPYETVAYGFSRFCSLFTYEEWKGLSYSIDIAFSGTSGFQIPRATGLGYQQEVIARLRNHTLGYSGSNINVTLDSNPETFPLNQSLYFDFSHDTNIISILAAFGLRQFAEPFLPATGPPSPAPPHNFTVAHITPFGARLDMELIRTPRPLRADRTGYVDDNDKETRYVHFVLNQRTVPLGLSLPECDAARVDGWCELGAFLRAQDRMPALAQYEKSCYGDLSGVRYGDVGDGAPPV